MATTPVPTRYSDRILEQLLRLRAADALPLRSGDAAQLPERIWRFEFRAGGWPVHIDLDDTVLEVRVHHGRESIAKGRVPEGLMRVLLGSRPAPTGLAAGASAEESMAALRAIVGDWRRGNARVFIDSPSVARHQDGWNNA